jgi:hypothetical protein
MTSNPNAALPARERFQLAFMDMGFRPDQIDSLLHTGEFERIPFEDAVAKVRLLVDGLESTDLAHRALLHSKPFRFPLEHLATVRIRLVDEGMKPINASGTLANAIEIVAVPMEMLEETLGAWRVIIPLVEARCYFLHAKPKSLLKKAAELLTKERLPWNDDIASFWEYYNGTATRVPPSATIAPPRPPRTPRPLREKPARPAKPLDPLTKEFSTMGTESDDAADMAARFRRAYGERAEGALAIFTQRGWSALEIRQLVTQNRSKGWRSDPATFFGAEDELVSAGFSAADARRVLTRSDRFCHLSLEPVKAAVATLCELGYRNQLGAITLSEPRALFVKPDLIRQWHEEVTASAEDPLLLFRELPSYRPRPKLQAPPQPVHAVAAFTTTIPADARPEQPHRVLETAVSQTAATPPPAAPEASTPTGPPQDPPASKDEADPPPPSQDDADDEGDLDEPDGEDDEGEEKDEEQPDEQVARARNRGAPNAGRYTDPLNEHVTRWEPFIRAQFVRDPKKKDEDEATPASEKPQPAKRTSKMYPMLEPEQWAEHSAQYAWMWDPNGPAYRVLGILKQWCVEARTMRNIIRDERLHPILRAEDSAIEQRMRVLRKLGRDFIDAPDLLLHPWESLPENEIKIRYWKLCDALVANADMARDAAEKSALRKPYILMILDASPEEMIAHAKRQLARID